MNDSNQGLTIFNEPPNLTFWQNETLDTSNNTLSEFPLLYEAPASIVTLLSIFYGGISVIAVIGNALVIWIVATTRQMHTVTNMYIANLALADVIIGVFCIPFQFQAALLQRWNLPNFMCAFCPFVQVVSVNVSVFTLTAIAVDRHRAIMNPLRARPTKSISKIIIFSIWAAAVAFAVPSAIAFRVIMVTDTIKRRNVTMNITRPFCENENLSDEQLQSYRYYLVFIQYVVPFCIISFVYIQMAIKLWGSKTPGNAQDSRDMTLLKNKKKVIKMLIIVVVVFGLCWLPLQTYNILYVTWDYINEYQYINIVFFVCDWLAMSNSCYNPFIYGIYNEKFKREFHRRFSFCFFGFEAGDNDKTTSIYTRASSIRSTTTMSVRNRNMILMHHQQQHNNGPGLNDDTYNILGSDNNKPLMNNNRLLGLSPGGKVTWNRNVRNSYGSSNRDPDDHTYSQLAKDKCNHRLSSGGTCSHREFVPLVNANTNPEDNTIARSQSSESISRKGLQLLNDNVDSSNNRPNGCSGSDKKGYIKPGFKDTEIEISDYSGLDKSFLKKRNSGMNCVSFNGL